MRAHFNWKLTLFVAIFLPLTIRLGFWQLDRADQKREMLAAHEQLMGEAPIAYEMLLPEQIVNYRNVRVSGELNPQIFLLDNQMHKGKAGYEVLQLLETGKYQLFVSRGWLEGSPDRRILPKVSTPAGELVLTGYLYEPQYPVTLSDDLMSDGWPKVIQAFTAEKLFKALGKDGNIPPPFLLRLDVSNAIAFTQHWHVVGMQPEKHTGYAVQWFGISLVLVVLFFYVSLKPERKNNAEQTNAD